MVRPLIAFAAVLMLVPSLALAEGIRGDYLESRTCDIYTGPCFANAQVGLAGKEAILAWSITSGEFGGVDVAGLKVIAAVSASDTLGFGGGLKINPYPIKSVVIVDEKATLEQREALVNFVGEHGGKAIGDIVRVTSSPIEMTADHFRQVGTLNAGTAVELLTRKLGQNDCVCTNEMIFYPPLVELNNYRPAYTVTGEFAGTGLGARWSNPGTRSAFLATFAY